MEEMDIIHIALDNIQNNEGLNAHWKERTKGPFDGILVLKLDDTEVKFNVEIKKELRQYQAMEIVNRNVEGLPLMIVAYKIYPKVKEYLRQENVAYLEANGNIYAKHKGEFLIWWDLNKQLKKPKENISRAFTRTGIQTVFHFLLNEELINKTHRKIANTADIALGNVNNVLKGLKDLGFLIQQNENEIRLIEKMKLLEKWIEAYEEKLKPKLKIGEFRFLKEEDERKWVNIQLHYEMTQWGGEPAGDLLTEHLRPEEFTLYTLETRTELMKNYKLVPDDNGNISVYKNFWGKRPLKIGENIKTVPAILVYADLINTNDKRCIETAEIIFDDYIKDYI